MSITSQPAAPTKNKYGHKYDGQLKTLSGYAVCSACGCHENTDESVTACPGGVANTDEIIVLSMTPEAIRQRKFKAERKAKGLVCEEYTATPLEHVKLKKLLAEMRA